MVPVLDENKVPLMPCSEKRARKLLDRGDARPYWCKGVFCIILQRPPKSRYKQDVVVGIDPGSKFEGLTVKSEAHTLLNVQTEAKTDVKRKMESRKLLREKRRHRNTRYRACRYNRAKRSGFIPPSTKARWDWKLSLLDWFRKMYPVTDVGIEDIKAKTIKGAKRWNRNFTPIETGKTYFEEQVCKRGLRFHKFQGYETAEIRNGFGLKKNSKKDKKDFYTHCVDSWCIANEVVGKHDRVDNDKVLYLKPLRRHRRRLHYVNPTRLGFRKKYGSTRSDGFERGTLVIHAKYGLTLIGGCSNKGITLREVSTNKVIHQYAKAVDMVTLTNMKWNISKI